MKKEFDKWIFEVCKYYNNIMGNRKELQEIYCNIDLTDAKLSFIDGMSPLEYVESKKYKL